MVNDGGPAFPAKIPMSHAMTAEACDFMFFPGITIRDYFAAEAMKECSRGIQYPPFESTAAIMAQIARHAYALADAMIAERNRNNDRL